MMNWDMSHILMAAPITAATINDVFLSPEFRIILYSFIAVIIFLVTLYFKMKRFTYRDAFKKGVIAAFFASGLLYALHADIGWSQWLTNDIKMNLGLSTDEKLKKMDDGLYDFCVEAGKIINDEYQLFLSDNHISLSPRLQYYLLPLHRRDHAKYIIVIADREARFDEAKSLFISGKSIIHDVKPVLRFAQNAYVLKRL